LRASATALLAAATAALAALTGCGSGAGQAQPAATAKKPAGQQIDLTRVDVANPAHVKIVSPSPGAKLKAGLPRGSEVPLATVVTGTAEPYQSVRVAAARCPARTCSVYVVSEQDGRWRAKLRTLVPLRRSLTLDADYALPHAGVTATKVRVKLQARKPHKSSHSAKPLATPKAPAEPVTPPVTSQTPSAGLGGPESLMMIGDSLSVGIKPYLSGFLPGWKIGLNGRVGRPLAEGMGILARTQLPSDGSTVLAMSLFTNDAPTHTAQLQEAVRTALGRVGSHGCLLWGTIDRPPLGGVSYAAANSLLKNMASSDPRLHVVPVAEAMKANPQLLRPDKVHPTSQGYQLLAQLYAQAARDC
jgi:hypothetical protein